MRSAIAHRTDVTNTTGNASAMNAMQRQQMKNGVTGAVRLTAVAAALVAVLGLTAGAVSAQVAPDAGRVLQDTMPTETGPLSPSARIELEAGALEDMERGGATVRIASVRITGNTVYSETELLAVLGNVAGRDYDLAGLRSLANEISRHYRASGYPFARAYLPEQDVSAGQLRIDVIEGRYGEVRTSGNARVAAPAQRYLRPLQGGDVISTSQLERTTLLLGDLPGVTITPVMRPGATTGAGDLDVLTEAGPRVRADFGTENHGNRFSGEYRANATVRVNRAAIFGDELLFRATYTDEGMWLGQIGYELPLGARGLRANVGYARTSYDLRAPFEDYSGTAKVANAGISYQLLRSRQTNLSLSAGYRYKDLDTQLLGFSIDAKSSRSWPLGVNFDRRDGFGGGGVTWIAAEIVPGRLDADNAGAIDGSFTRSYLQAARIQNLPGRLSMMTRVSGQWANRDLDSSESFVLGGAGGVRAYPQGEAAGSEGWLGQLELRYTVGNATPFVFYDSGRIKSDAMQASRRISGAGVGVRYQHSGIFLDLATAWRSSGGLPQSDDRTRSPRAWMSVSYAF